MDIKGLFLQDLAELLRTKYNLPKFRAKQIYQWVFQKNVADWQEMTDLPRELRNMLMETGLSLTPLAVEKITEASDGTKKFLFKLVDGQFIEGVYLPEKERNTICFSTQVGCKMGCRFCATGQNGFVRNLSAGEIVDQPLTISRYLGRKINNIVAMGQGDPFDNYEALLKAVRIINDQKGLGIGARHITISTCGLIPGINKLMEEGLQVGLAISLHAAEDELRNYLMPINRKYPLNELIKACHKYIEKTKRRITFEYTMLKGINDRPRDMENLSNLLRGLLCHVNLIPFNKVTGTSLQRSLTSRINEFAYFLNNNGIETTIRKERGLELAAACGQLSGKRQKT